MRPVWFDADTTLLCEACGDPIQAGEPVALLPRECLLQACYDCGELAEAGEAWA